VEHLRRKGKQGTIKSRALTRQKRPAKHPNSLEDAYEDMGDLPQSGSESSNSR
jgi:hypothetical protein